MTIAKIATGPVAMPAAERPGAAGFSVPAPAQAACIARTPGSASVASPGALDAMLALQEEQAAEQAIPVRDRHARRRGQGLLTALAALQQAMLGDGDADAALHQLAALADGPPAATPQLEAVVQALSLRARIELARRGL